MNIILAGGTGFIGQAMVKHYLKVKHDITIISRSEDKVKKRFSNTVTPLTWSRLKTEGVKAIENTDVIINLTGANIGNRPWTAKRKQEILNSRIESTQQLSALCASRGTHAPMLLNASAVGTYGLQDSVPDQLPAPLNETTPIDFNQSPDFLAKIGRQWELATQSAKDAGVRVVNMRFGVVLGKGGGVLKQLKLPFLFFIGGPIGSGQQPFSWIALPDLLNAVDFLIENKEIVGPVNLTSPHCVMQKDLAKALGRTLHRPSFMPTPAFVLKIVFGEMAEALLLKGQHVIPTVLTDHGFNFQYPDIDSALNDALSH